MNILKNIKKYIIVACVSCLLFSCVDDGDLGDNYFTFTGETISDYLKSRPDEFSDFYAWVKEVEAVDLLSAYGTYTCFAPTNEAIDAYKQKVGRELSLAEKKQIVYGHLIQKAYPVTALGGGVLDVANMENRYITSRLVSNQKIEVNGSSLILHSTVAAQSNEDDEVVQNGIVHTIDAVLNMPNSQLPELIGEDKRYSLFHEALTVTGLSDSLRLIEDADYRQITGVKNWRNQGSCSSPKTKKYGYTALIESNETFLNNPGFSIENLDQLKTYAASVYDKMYPADKGITDITDRRNSLNRFIAYHLFDRILYNNEFVPDNNAVVGIIAREYFETMCPNTLLEAQSRVATPGSGTKEPAFNMLNNGTGVRITTAHHDNEATLNGVYHEITSILVYDDKVINQVLNRRLRFDGSSFFSELVNNKVRGSKTAGGVTFLPQGYLKNMESTADTRIFYLAPNVIWNNYQGDEMMIAGVFDFTVTLPPIPKGVYEVRFGYTANNLRAVAQLYFDDEPCGIPLDLSILAKDPRIGWVLDKTTSDNGVENDKMMKNRGYLKGPTSYESVVGGVHGISRDHEGGLRRVLGQFDFQDARKHTFRVRSVNNNDPLREFHFDYIEFVPKRIIEEGESRD